MGVLEGVGVRLLSLVLSSSLDSITGMDWLNRLGGVGCVSNSPLY